ncbi:hypothetical protein D3C77_363660 [compost metagenome]
MMFCNLVSTSSNVQASLALFCAISSADTATPPAFAALAGPKYTSFLRYTSIASKVEGMLAPSATYFTPLATNVFAASSLISFCVAHGSAISQGILQMFWQPSTYLAVGCSFTYSLIRFLSTSLSLFTVLRLIPSLSYTYPLESLHATTFAPSSCAFSIA